MMRLDVSPKGKKKTTAYFIVLNYIAVYDKANPAAIRSPCLATASFPMKFFYLRGVELVS